MPLVTVLLPVYNGGQFIQEAIDSVCNQTFEDFELLVIDDGSTDNTPEILLNCMKRDRRIRVITQENRGLIETLNRGCRLIQCPYIARMDADDITLPLRFEKEVAFLESHPDIGIVGTWTSAINEHGEYLHEWHVPTSPGSIRWSLLFGTSLAHPAVMMRRDVIEQVGYYRKEALHAEDYDLWVRASRITQLANIPEILHKRRVWGGSITTQHFDRQEHTILEIMQSFISPLLDRRISLQETNNLHRMDRMQPLKTREDIESTRRLLQDIYTAYLLHHPITLQEKKEIAFDTARKLCTLSGNFLKHSPLRALTFLLQAFRLSPDRLPLRMAKSFFRRLTS